MTGQVHIDIEESDASAILVAGDDALHTRPMRRFFRTILGAEEMERGWRVPIRRARRQDVILRINNHLVAARMSVVRGVMADRHLELALERQRGLVRSREGAIAWREGHGSLADQTVADNLTALGWRHERELFPHQLRNVGHALAAINHANFSVPGAGKTATALAVAATHFAATTVDAIIVVGPLASFEPWESETTAALGDLFVTKRVRGTASQRRALYGQARRGSLLLTSYASAAADRPALNDLCESLNVMLIVDESHRVKRFRGGLWAPALAEIAELAKVRMILSGTPMPNSPRDLYSQLTILWPGGLLTGTRDQFAARVERSFDSVLREIGPFTTRTAKSELGLRPYKVECHEAELTGTQAEIYELIRNRLRGAVDMAGTWEDKMDALRRARPIRLLQAATNPDLLNHPDEVHHLPALPDTNPTLLERLSRFSTTETPAKWTEAKRLLEGLTGAGEKVVVWSNFVRNLDFISQRVRNELKLAVFQVDGRVPTGDEPIHDTTKTRPLASDTRETRIERFLNHSGPAVLVTNPATSSESISLHRACHHAVYLDRTYDAALFLQSIDRIHRLGLDPRTEVTVHILQATLAGSETIDHLVDASLRGKQADMERLLEGAEIHPLHQDSAQPEGDIADIEALLRFLIGEEVESEL